MIPATSGFWRWPPTPVLTCNSACPHHHGGSTSPNCNGSCPHHGGRTR